MAGNRQATDYHFVAASTTDDPVDGGGFGSAKKGDYISGVLIIPNTKDPGVVTLKDGDPAGTPRVITLYPGGITGSAAFHIELIPTYLPVEQISKLVGGFHVTTGANVSCLLIGAFK